MIQLLIILAGIVVLGLIFVRRYMMVEKGAASLPSFSLLGGKKRSVWNLLRFHKDHKDKVEVTVDEMIPEPSTVDAKSSVKANTMVKKADAALQKGDQKHGEQFLIQALSFDPSNPETYHKLGLLYLHQGQFGKAENMYQKLVVSGQNDPVYFSNLALALYQQKKLEGAKSHYKKAIELDAARPGRFFSLGQVLKEMNELQEAVEHFKKAVDMDPKNLDYLLTLAEAYGEAGMPDDARALLGEILAAFPDNAIAQEMMAKIPVGGGEGNTGG